MTAKKQTAKKQIAKKRASKKLASKKSASPPTIRMIGKGDQSHQWGLKANILSDEKRAFVVYMLSHPDATLVEGYTHAFDCSEMTAQSIRTRASAVWKQKVIQTYVEDLLNESFIADRMTVEKIVFSMHEAFVIAKNNSDPNAMVNSMKAIASMLGKDKGQAKSAESATALAEALMAHASNTSLPSPDEIIEDAEYVDVTN